MSPRPDDIPQDVRSAAWDLGMALLGPDTCSDEDLDRIALAILAAKAEEREAIAAYHDEARQELNRLALKFEESGNKTQADRCITRSSVHAIAAQVIRKRGEA